MQRLTEHFPHARLSVVVVLREPAEFLASYRVSSRWLDGQPSSDTDSILYSEPDSWLVDYDGRILAQDVIAPVALPGFDNSAVDGWAVRHADLSADAGI